MSSSNCPVLTWQISGLGKYPNMTGRLDIFEVYTSWLPDDYRNYIVLFFNLTCCLSEAILFTLEKKIFPSTLSEVHTLTIPWVKPT